MISVNFEQTQQLMWWCNESEGDEWGGLKHADDHKKK